MHVVIVVAERGPLDQPYLACLYHELLKRFRVSIVVPTAFQSRSGTLDKSEHRHLPTRREKFFGKLLAAKLKAKVACISFASPVKEEAAMVGLGPIGEVAACLQSLKADHVIAVDFPALMAAQLIGLRAHLVSLELWHRRIENLLVKDATILSCVTQNWLRYLALFPRGKVPYFLVPNFSNFSNLPLREATDDSFVLAGSAVPGFGLDIIVEYIKRYPRKGALLGWTPPNIRDVLLDRGLSAQTIDSLDIQQGFLPEDRFIDKLAAHRFGFSFYDLKHADTSFLSESLGIFPWSAMNYITGFPGKIGMCMNAGVPVIASNLPGMEFVREYGAGVVVNETSPEAIEEARCQIFAGGNEMRRRCLKLAEEYSFERCISPFLDFLQSS